MPPRNSGAPEKVDIIYIAKLAGVSPSTVSRALRGDPAANSETATRVLKIARELNYFPNALAKGLRQQCTRTIGIILNDLTNPFYTEVLSVIGETLYGHRYSMIVCYSNYDAERERENVLTLLSRRVDGVIMSPVDDRSPNVRMLVDNGVETVLIDTYPYHDDISCVYTDHQQGAALATEHLINNGHRDILLFTGPLESSLAKQFVDGYTETLASHGLPFRPEYILQADELSIEGGHRAFVRLLTKNSAGKNVDFTGVAAISDLLAIGIYQAANELRFSIPGTYSVIGYDDITVTGALTPPLTTVHQPRRRIGIESTGILLSNLEGKERLVKRVGFEPYLVKRGSVQKVAR